MSESEREAQVQAAMRRYSNEHLTDGFSVVKESLCTQAMLTRYLELTHGKPRTKQLVRDAYGNLYLIVVYFDEQEDKEVFWVVNNKGSSAKFEV